MRQMRHKFHTLFQGGEKILRRNFDSCIEKEREPFRAPRRRARNGIVKGPAEDRGRGAWYVPVVWDGQPENRIEWVHVNRVVILETADGQRITG